MSTLADHCPVCHSTSLIRWGSAADIGNANILHNIAKCRGCTHLFIHPLPSRAFLAEAYRNSSTSVSSGSDFYDSRSLGSFAEGDLWVLKHTGIVKGQERFVDIGSASLKLLSKVLESGWKVSIVEPSEQINRMRSIRLEEVCHGLFEDCIFTNRFDIVSAMDVLEHTHSPIDFLKKAKHILSETGLVVLRFPNSYSLKCRFSHNRWQMIRPLGHLHFFSPRSFRVACRICELKIVQMKSHDLDDYRSLSVAGKTVRGMRFMHPLKGLFNQMLLGDQLLVAVTHE